MQRNKWLQLIGKVLGETVHAFLLALGLITGLVLLLNGFDAMSAAHFAENFFGRMTSAEGAVASRYVWMLTGLTFGLTALILLARFIDRTPMLKRSAP